ncbi:phosphatase PAP2 family protein [Kitasatospora sp. NPDC052896]|uniref:phosphatase PAP2 family protein n=1 Tax=Kitasatospora sp. NPDC052896 TaxID=3364061 RepID=UPI0037C93AC7
MGEPTEIQSPGAERATTARGGGSVQSPGRPADGPADGAGASTALRGASGVRAWISAQRQHPARPKVVFELALIAISYWLYSLVRNAVPEQASAAERNAFWVWHTEQGLGVAVERSINHAVNSVTWLIVGMNYYYATLHFIMTIGVLVWLYRCHPGRYAASRTVLFITTGIALVGFYFYPLAPPRLMTDGHFIDTVAVHHTWGSLASGPGASVSNQFAAMPSMHIGWSSWCGLTIFFLAERKWVRALGLAYPAATLMVIISTANHFWMDAVGGAVCLAIGFTVTRLVYHRWAYQFPQVPVARQSPPQGASVPEQRPTPVGAGSRQ